MKDDKRKIIAKKVFYDACLTYMNKMLNETWQKVNNSSIKQEDEEEIAYLIDFLEALGRADGDIAEYVYVYKRLSFRQKLVKVIEDRTLVGRRQHWFSEPNPVIGMFLSDEEMDYNNSYYSRKFDIRENTKDGLMEVLEIEGSGDFYISFHKADVPEVEYYVDNNIFIAVPKFRMDRLRENQAFPEMGLRQLSSGVK
jgi:hypothetical protein